MSYQKSVVLNPINQSPESFKSMQKFAGKLRDALKQVNAKNVHTVAELCSFYEISKLPSPTANDKREAIHEHTKFKDVAYVLSFSSSLHEGSEISGLAVEFNPKIGEGYADAKLLYRLIENNTDSSGAVHGTRYEEGRHIRAAGGMENFLYDAAQILSAHFRESQLEDFNKTLSLLRNAVKLYGDGANSRFDDLISKALLLAGLSNTPAPQMIVKLATNYGTSATLYVEKGKGVFVPSLTLTLYNEFNNEEKAMFEISQQNYINAIAQFVNKKLALQS